MAKEGEIGIKTFGRENARKKKHSLIVIYSEGNYTHNWKYAKEKIL